MEQVYLFCVISVFNFIFYYFFIHRILSIIHTIWLPDMLEGIKVSVCCICSPKEKSPCKG